VEGAVKARIIRRSQGCIVRARAEIAWRDVVAGRRMDVVTNDYPYNVRPVRAEPVLEVWASMPPLVEVETSRRRWLAAEVEQAARALCAPAGPGDAAAVNRRDAGTEDSAPSDASARAALDAIRCVAEGKGWRASASAEGKLEIALVGSAEPTFAARAETEGARIEVRVPILAASGSGPTVRAAVIHAVLSLNARFALARLRVLGTEPLVLRIEHRLPATGLLDDEIDYALEGVRYAAGEAARTFGPLHHPSVAREYARAYHLAL
jgi:hypothetical protein